MGCQGSSAGSLTEYIHRYFGEGLTFLCDYDDDGISLL